MKRVPLAAALALQALLVAAVLRPDGQVPDDVDPQIYRANRDVWLTLPETERDVLRERWVRFAALPSSDQETLLQRSETLRRLSSSLEQRQGHEPTAEESVAELVHVVEGARQMLQRPGSPPPADPDLHLQMEQRTRRSVDAFLGNLAKRGNITQQELTKLRAEPLSELLRDAMLHLKAEQIGLYSEGVRPDEAASLLGLAPLDVVAKAERRRQQVGFLGLLGQAVPYSEADRTALEGLSTPQERCEKLRDLKASQIRELLAAHGLSAERIDELLTGPVNELERAAQDVLKGKSVTRPAATAPAAPPR